MASAKQRIKDALSGPLRPNPILSAMQFAGLTATHGGATMNVHSHEFTTSPGGSGYIVGGSVSQRSGERVPTVNTQTLTGRHPSLPDVIRQTGRVKREMPTDQHANVGSWLRDDGTIDWDASEVDPDPVRARRKMLDRDEDAIHAAGPGWDIANHLKRKRRA